jgi:tetratricopeptide (TPR) repeat protein
MTVQLIDAGTDTHVWAESFDRDTNDSVSLPREVAQSVARQLHSAVPPTAPVRYVRPEAHDAYLHGRYLWLTFLNNAQAGKYFLKAAELQPDYALAWTGVADYYLVGAVDGELSPRDSLPSAKAAALRAVEQDDSEPEVHLSLCGVALFVDWNWQQALQECGRAIELDPKFAEAYHFKAKVLSCLNRRAESIQSERKAMELNPSVRPWALAFALNTARQYDAAITEAQARLESTPADIYSLWNLEYAYRCKGMQNEAVQTAEKAFRISGDNDAAIAAAQAFQRGGYRAVLQCWLSDSKKRSQRQYVSPVTLANLTAQLREREETLALLEQGYEEHSPLLLDIDVQFDPAYDFLHSDGRYRSIIKKIGLPPAY